MITATILHKYRVNLGERYYIHHSIVLEVKTIDKDQIIVRLKKAEGQLRGIQKMIENDRDYLEVLYQITAVQAATENVAIAIIENHIRICIKNAIQNKDENKEIQKLINAIKLSIKH